MRVRAILFVLVLLAAVESPAYVVASRIATIGPTGPDTGTVNMVFSGTNLHFENFDFREAGLPRLGAPAVVISGNSIQVVQTYAPPLAGPYQDVCQVEDVNVGTLPPGIYGFLWSYSIPSGRVDIIRLMRMDVKPCSGTPRPNEPIITLTRTATGTALLHIESLVEVSDPQFGALAITSKANGGIDVEQPLSDSGMTTAAMCHAEDLDLGALASGPWTIGWLYRTTSGLRGGAGAAFVWSEDGPQCTSSGIFSTSPAVPVNTAPVTMTFSRATIQFASSLGQSASVSGDRIGVHDEMMLEAPVGAFGAPSFHCYTSSATVPRLPVGSYDVKWNVVADGPSSSTLDSFHFNVVQGRRRSARR